MPFTFADVLILRYLVGMADENGTLEAFNTINDASNLNWAFRSHLRRFIKRFWDEPYKKEDAEWIRKLADEKNINIKDKMTALYSSVKKNPHSRLPVLA